LDCSTFWKAFFPCNVIIVFVCGNLYRVVEMSATIFWGSINTKTKHLYVMAPSCFMGCLERAEMELPNTFGANDIQKLRGLAAAMDEKRNSFNELIEAIEKHGSVNVWYEY
jgi:hypothetical protein